MYRRLQQDVHVKLKHRKIQSLELKDKEIGKVAFNINKTNKNQWQRTEETAEQQIKT